MNKSLVFSLCGHLCLFFFFGFTFQNTLIRPQQEMVFGGRIFRSNVCVLAPQKAPLVLPGRLVERDPAVQVNSGFSQGVSGYSFSKPAPRVALSAEKSLPPGSSPELVTRPALRESQLVLHPLLPSQLELYFKDRQEVHIELLFTINPTQEKRFIEVKRRISSGNLQADLLSKRYISHYLFIQRGRFEPGQWLPVKVDLSGQPHDTH